MLRNFLFAIFTSISFIILCCSQSFGGISFLGSNGGVYIGAGFSTINNAKLTIGSESVNLSNSDNFKIPSTVDLGVFFKEVLGFLNFQTAISFSNNDLFAPKDIALKYFGSETNDKISVTSYGGLVMAGVNAVTLFNFSLILNAGFQASINYIKLSGSGKGYSKSDLANLQQNIKSIKDTQIAQFKTTINDDLKGYAYSICGEDDLKNCSKDRSECYNDLGKDDQNIKVITNNTFSKLTIFPDVPNILNNSSSNIFSSQSISNIQFNPVLGLGGYLSFGAISFLLQIKYYPLVNLINDNNFTLLSSNLSNITNDDIQKKLNEYNADNNLKIQINATNKGNNMSIYEQNYETNTTNNTTAFACQKNTFTSAVSSNAVCQTGNATGVKEGDCKQITDNTNYKLYNKDDIDKAITQIDTNFDAKSSFFNKIDTTQIFFEKGANMSIILAVVVGI